MSRITDLTEAETMRGKIRSYKDAIQALNTLQSNYSSIEAHRKLGPAANKNQLSIDEVYEYTRRLGYSPLDFNKLNVIHITGTKGKGSTCAFTESILQKYNIGKIGMFTSPHLKTVRERIKINGNPINEMKFTKYFFEVWDKLSSTESSADKFPTLQPSNIVKPMYFKYLTILSFHVFISEGVDTAIYEVGVGGQYDSTNIIQKPSVAGISSLGIDHTFMLGNTIESITWNKTGILKKGRPAVASVQTEYPESMKIIEDRAKEIGISHLDFVTADGLPENIKLGLAGKFQRQNAALATRLATIHLEQLGEKDIPAEGVLPDRFLDGLADAKWDGRCQVIKGRDDWETVTWYVDGAHTIDSIKASTAWFNEETKNNKSHLKVLLFNQQSRDNATTLVETLYESGAADDIHFDHAVFTTNVTWSDGNYNPDLVSINNSKEMVDNLTVQKALAEIWNNLDHKFKQSSRKHIFHDIETSVNFIKSLKGEASAVDVFVCGSLHLVGGFMVVLDNDKE